VRAEKRESLQRSGDLGRGLQARIAADQDSKKPKRGVAHPGFRLRSYIGRELLRADAR
jgi:hypothetical protein